MTNHLQAPVQESRRSIVATALYAAGCAVVSVCGYALLDAGPTIEGRRNAEVTLAQIEACARGDRSLDIIETVDVEGRPSEAAHCADTVVVYQADGITPDWQATSAPAKRQREQKLLLPDADEFELYEVVGLFGVIAGLGLLEARTKKHSS